MNASTRISIPGERARAHVSSMPRPHDTRVQTITLEDGSLVIPPASLAQLGDGDEAKGRFNARLLMTLELDRKTPRPVGTLCGPIEKPKTVRGAVPADERAILELLLLDVAENAAHIAPPNEERILAHIQHGTQGKGGMVGVIDGPDGKPVAVVVMVDFQWWWSVQRAFQELVLYVHPDHRRSNHLADLIQFQKWAVDEMTKRSGYRVYLMLGVMGIHKVREKIMLYRRKLSRQVGAAWIYPSPFPEDR